MWCRIIKKPISDISETETKEKCTTPMLDCSLCPHCTSRDKEVVKKIELIESYTEENYSMEELIKIIKEKTLNSRKEGLSLEFITHKAIHDKNGKVIGITTLPAKLNIYKIL